MRCGREELEGSASSRYDLGMPAILSGQFRTTKDLHIVVLKLAEKFHSFTFAKE